MPQVALFGRSNVGKSSLINDLFQQRGLARTSSTPGKTQLLNFFLIDEKILFVDLPGYGYAEVSQKKKRDWGLFIEEYLSETPPDLALFLVDSRRTPAAKDEEMFDFLQNSSIKTVIVLTKVDKLSKNERLTNTKKILEKFDLPYVHYSSLKREGRQKLIQMVLDGLAKKK